MLSARTTFRLIEGLSDAPFDTRAGDLFRQNCTPGRYFESWLEVRVLPAQFESFQLITAWLEDRGEGRSLLSAPRTDPSGPDSGTRLPPWVYDGKAFFRYGLPYALQRV